MNYYKLSNNTLTLKSGYIMSAVSMLLLSFVWVFLDTFLNYFKSQISFELLQSSLNSGNYKSAYEISVSRLEPSISNNILSKLFFTIPSLSSYAKKNNFPQMTFSQKLQEDIFLLNTYAEKNDIKKASEQLANITSEFQKLGILNVKKIKDIVSDTEALLKSSKLENGNIEKQDLECDNLEARKTRVARRHLLLADEFGLFLSLKPAYKKGTEFDVYTSGVLAGLPILKDLKDGIGSLFLLKEELDKIGGNVSIQSNNAYEVFTGRLLSLQESSKSMRAEHQDILNKLKLLKKEKKQTKNILKANKSKIAENMKSLILTINGSFKE